MPTGRAAVRRRDGLRTARCVSHASEDKKSFVDDLVGRLQSLKQRVWYDKDQILSGDAPVVSIEEGLKRSRHAVLVISRQSIDKPGWVSAEWEALLTAQISLGKPTIHCVLLGVEHAELMDAKPFLGRGRSLKGDTGDYMDPARANVNHDRSKSFRIQQGTTPVKRYAASPWGLFDVHGNVWEWCTDSWPRNPSAFVVRGGSWFHDPDEARSAHRRKWPRRAPAHALARHQQVAVDRI